jgi:leucyl/phenylalanyl-tRNA--protein transferase
MTAPAHRRQLVLTPELLLTAYRSGIFPMAEPEHNNRIYWFAPDPRAILPLDGFHCPKTLLRVVRAQRFTVTCDRAFTEVMRACAEPRPEADRSWISEEIITAYTQLHRLGFAHSVECWLDGALVGGLYGVSIGAAFMGESMFHRATDASKVALYHLVERLNERGFQVLDVQFTTPHLLRFGVIEISRDEYEARLAQAVDQPVTFA